MVKIAEIPGRILDWAQHRGLFAEVVAYAILGLLAFGAFLAAVQFIRIVIRILS